MIITTPLLAINEDDARVILLLTLESNKRTSGVLSLEDKAIEFLDRLSSNRSAISFCDSGELL